MHTLHFLLVMAESALDAASEAESTISDWGDCNNWHCIGGIASEDGIDDIENHEDARWGLSYLCHRALQNQPLMGASKPATIPGGFGHVG